MPVEISERLHDGDTGLFEAAREEAIGAAGELVLHEQFEELEMRERGGFGHRSSIARFRFPLQAERPRDAQHKFQPVRASKCLSPAL